MLLMRHAKALFLVNDDQPQILELHVARNKAVRPDDDVYFAGRQFEKNFGLFPWRTKTRKHLDAHRKAASLCMNVS